MIAGSGTRNAQKELNEFDRWLRADGNRRNPGTTADLVAASLFAAFRRGGAPRSSRRDCSHSQNPLESIHGTGSCSRYEQD